MRLRALPLSERVDAYDRKADIWILPSCQRLHAAVGKTTLTPGEADEEITTKGAEGTTDEKLLKTEEMGLSVSYAYK